LRLLLVLGGLAVGLLLAELLLAALDRPRFYRPHTFPKQFDFLPISNAAFPVYVNARSSRIRFVYDGNPRGYFGPANEVDHHTSSLGFRGPELPLSIRDNRVITTKPEGTVRLVFLGDSFTFGEGVRDDDTYPAQTAYLLQQHYPTPSPHFESFNLGVGGYNTSQSLLLLERIGLDALPDCVVLGYVLNDAEPPLFQRDPKTGRPYRAARPVEEGAGDPRPPESWLYRLRTARAVWQVLANRRLTQQTLAHYREIYDENSPGWQESRRALGKIIKHCADRHVPCYVLLFPVLYQLDDQYPFLAIHEQIRAEVTDTSALFIDLFPRLKGQRAEDLWVHPSDHHPNEKVHRIAAEALCEELLKREKGWPTASAPGLRQKPARPARSGRAAD
jgi:hypothetical protein